MKYAPPPPPALIDRHLLSTSTDDQRAPKRISELARSDRWVLFGEPGSGKSTVFEQAAAAAGTQTVTARAFAGGHRPPGAVVFIDALEEYRISQPGRDRLVELVEALKGSPYVQWRITCRAVSLPPADLAYMAKELSGFETWQLDFLDLSEQKAILHSIGEADPDAFIRKIHDMAAGSLLGNPATLKLLHDTARKATAPIHTRGALLAEATRLMAAEVDETMPDRPDRPTEGAIITAAEKACLVLVLSAREEIWIDRGTPKGELSVTKDDLLPLEIDTEALRYALDTPMFRGEGGSFMPTHRIVAEYLAGRALAGAVSGVDGAPAALPVERAIALLSGDDGKPAPALMGTFAWFVSALSKGVHQDRALKLIKKTPEAILLQGDAAMLPQKHRLALLETTGRRDPWFLSAVRGATAVGGLAGDDLQTPFEAILDDPKETYHRRGMVLEALTVGRPMPAMVAAVQRFIVNPANPYWLRRDAVVTIKAIAAKPNAEVRSVFSSLCHLTDEGSVLARLKALSMLVGVDATGGEVRRALADYAATRGDTMGYARSLGDAIKAKPLPGLFDKPMPVQRDVGRSRTFEIEGMVQSALAATIRMTPTMSVTDLLRWLGNTKLKSYLDPEQEVRAAIVGWLDADTTRPEALFWALHRQSHGEAWRSVYEYQRITGRSPSRSICEKALSDLAAIPAGKSDREALGLARQLVGVDSEPELYWRLWDLLEGRRGTKAVFKNFTQCSLDNDWRAKDALRKVKNAKKRDQQLASHRKWMADHEADIRSGVAKQCLCAAAEIYAGHHDDLAKGRGFDRVVDWAGETLAGAIAMGWDTLVAAYPTTIADLAQQEMERRHERIGYIVAAWTDHQLQQGLAHVVLPLNAMLAALNAVFIFNDNAPRDRVEQALVAAIGKDSGATAGLLNFWTILASRDEALPYAYKLEAEPAAGVAAERLLSAKAARPPQVLRSALVLIAKTQSPPQLRALIAKALKARLPKAARVFWTFVAFLVDPQGQQGAFKTALAEPDAHKLFDRLNNDHVLGAFSPLTDAWIVREAAIVRNLGPTYPPTDSFAGDRNSINQAVAGAIKAIAASPTAEATEALTALAAEGELGKWGETLRHYLESQRELRRQAEFRPPEPIAVARALRAGPPATPADLRAVVGEILADLAEDIRNGDTSGWRGFWNNPHDPDDPERPRRPKIENDCRDLLTDRIRDRLIRFGVGAKRTFTEARSVDERRADLLVIGEGAAALPLEAKRHTNDEVWTAPNVQLEPYTRSAGSSGHGVYLIFWFGVEAGGVPKRPAGVDRITTAEALRKAIIGVLTPEQKAKLDVVVLDVSPPPNDDAEAPQTPKALKTKKIAKASNKGEGSGPAKRGKTPSEVG